MNYYAKDFGIEPGNQSAKKISDALKIMSETEGEKTLVFEKGTYLLNSAECDEKKLFITNTVGDEEFGNGETPHLNHIGLNFQNISDLTLQGNGAFFLIDGKVTNIAIENCSNLTIDGISIDSDNPDLHELRVESVSPFSVTFVLDKISRYKPFENRFAFVGTDYDTDFYENRVKAWWTARIRSDNEHHVERNTHPFLGALKIKEISDHRFKASYASTRRFKKGDIFYVFNTRRQYAGIFVNASKNITLKNVSQHFNFSLALVCQDTENITVDSVNFAPNPTSGRLFASLADFIQICMCKGKVSVTNSHFSGAGDDTINVHGIHLIVKKINGNELTLKYMHPQAHGFNPLHSGDSIEFINPYTLLSKGKSQITDSRLADEHTIIVTVTETEGLAVGDAIEDTTMCPDLYFAGNTTDLIITRNMLITTRGKVVVENNRFLNSSMSAILIADDAKNWYESGMVLDAEIRNNYFGQCYEEFVKILPENGKNTVPVHHNIRITGNTFDSDSDKGIYIKCAKDVTVTGNTIKSSKVKNAFIKTVNSENITKDF